VAYNTAQAASTSTYNAALASAVAAYNNAQAAAQAIDTSAVAAYQAAYNAAQASANAANNAAVSADLTTKRNAVAAAQAAFNSAMAPVLATVNNALTNPNTTVAAFIADVSAYLTTEASAGATLLSALAGATANQANADATAGDALVHALDAAAVTQQEGDAAAGDSLVHSIDAAAVTLDDAAAAANDGLNHALDAAAVTQDENGAAAADAWSHTMDAAAVTQQENDATAGDAWGYTMSAATATLNVALAQAQAAQQGALANASAAQQVADEAAYSNAMSSWASTQNNPGATLQAALESAQAARVSAEAPAQAAYTVALANAGAQWSSDMAMPTQQYGDATVDAAQTWVDTAAPAYQTADDTQADDAKALLNTIAPATQQAADTMADDAKALITAVASATQQAADTTADDAKTYVNAIVPAQQQATNTLADDAAALVSSKVTALLAYAGTLGTADLNWASQLSSALAPLTTPSGANTVSQTSNPSPTGFQTNGAPYQTTPLDSSGQNTDSGWGSLWSSWRSIGDGMVGAAASAINATVADTGYHPDWQEIERRNPLGQTSTENTPGWVYYGTRGAITISVAAAGAALIIGTGEFAFLGNQSISLTNCFAAGTQVLMADERASDCNASPGAADHFDPTGIRASVIALARPATRRTQNIEDIVAGDVVLALDEPTGRREPRRVVRTFRNVADHRRFVRIQDADGDLQELTTTDGHPFFVVGAGWVLASELAAADNLLQADGRLSRVLSTAREAHPGGVAIFNFEVEGHHNYFVAQAPGHEPVLVHNISAVELIKLLKEWNELYPQYREADLQGDLVWKTQVGERLREILGALKGAGVNPTGWGLN